jgi:hypothetical protein
MIMIMIKNRNNRDYNHRIVKEEGIIIGIIIFGLWNMK